MPRPYREELASKYEELLERAYSKIKGSGIEAKRFEIPAPQSSETGGKTYVYNFLEICNRLNRDPHHVLKFLTREMATAGNLDGTRAIFKGKFDRATLSNLFQIYANKFVICPVCKMPDTKLLKEKRLTFLICEACGAKSSVI
ncbi:MAG: translation initiation factor IF-2 subunit beta [Candidatus Bathyarchaeia archaeon]